MVRWIVDSVLKGITPQQVSCCNAFVASWLDLLRCLWITKLNNPVQHELEVVPWINYQNFVSLLGYYSNIMKGCFACFVCSQLIWIKTWHSMPLVVNIDLFFLTFFIYDFMYNSVSILILNRSVTVLPVAFRTWSLLLLSLQLHRMKHNVLGCLAMVIFTR